MDERSHSRRARVLLTGGAGIGIVLAACGLFASRHEDGRSLPSDAVARVNGQVIGLTVYRRALSGLASDRREDLGAADRRRVLDRLIDEELLIQRALALGLAHSDRKIRADLASAVIASAVAGEESTVPSEQDVAELYAGHPEMFATSGRVRLRQIFFRVTSSADEPAAMEHAREAARRLRAGERFARVRAELGDEEISPLPDALLPQAKLVDYLGPTALRTASALAAGQVSEPVRSGQGVHVLMLVERAEERIAPLDEIRPQVIAELRRRQGERALRAYLDRLRAEARIEVRAEGS